MCFGIRNEASNVGSKLFADLICRRRAKYYLATMYHRGKFFKFLVVPV
jgi:hypothetical protein